MELPSNALELARDRLTHAIADPSRLKIQAEIDDAPEREAAEAAITRFMDAAPKFAYVLEL